MIEPDVVSSLHQSVGTRNGLGAVITGMERQGYDLEVAGWRLGWRAMFYLTGRVHSFTSSTGSAFEQTLARAIQKAARDALTAAPSDAETPDPEAHMRELEAEQALPG